MPSPSTLLSKAILWDNDGVLSDTERLFYEVNRDVLAEHGVDLTRERYVDWFLVANLGAWHVLSDRGYPAPELARLRIERNRRYSIALSTANGLTRPGLVPLLTRMKGRARMAIVTASFRDHLALAHGQDAFFEHFEAIFTRETSGQPKPAPDCYLKALDALQLTSDRCVVVEDSPRGLAAACAAGLTCIVIRSELLHDFPFVGAAAVVDNLTELERALDAFLAA
ncbi:HAD family phosphatase [Pandoraea sp. PE-S2R-1]|uniref:HAD family hydrolase n=1 Tax=Pandoraea sp. PE-S2R-1 TaxID=1986994 RepID=UPI000B4007F0|nr:HAD family phosphatase [Pandoraea sp. PE-S2R-1]